MDGEKQRLLVDRGALVIHQEHQNQATTLVGARLAGVGGFPIVVQVRVTGIDTFNATLIRILDKGDILAEATVQDHHPGCFEEDALVGITIVVGVIVLFSIGEHIDSSRPADTSQHCIL